MITRRELQQEYHRIPPFVPTLLRLADLILSGNYTIDEIIRVIRYDPGITVDVIRYANSAESAASRTIQSLQDAVVRLGGGRILRYLLGHWFHGSISASIGRDQRSLELWRHGIYAAVTADRIANVHEQFRHPAGFTVALLHDIGLIPLILYARRNNLDLSWNINEDDTEEESKLLGYSRAEVGAMLLEHWNFPKEMVDAVRFHVLGEGGPWPLTELVRIASYCACAVTIVDPETLNAYLRRVSVSISCEELSSIIPLVSAEGNQIITEIESCCF